MPDAALRVTLYQGPPSGGDVVGNLAAIAAAAAVAAAPRAVVLVTPEMSVTGYDIGDLVAERARPRDGEYFAFLSAAAAESGVAIVYGYPERAGDAVYNAVAFVGADGRLVAHYRKTHLFGEIDNTHFARGTELPVTFEYGGVPCGLLICYDVEFPEAVRRHADAGTELLLVPTGLMRPYDVVAERIVPARAYESQLYVAYTNRCGVEGGLEYAGLSTAVAPDGEILAVAGRAEQTLTFTASRAALHASRRVNTHLTDRRPELYGPAADR